MLDPFGKLYENVVALLGDSCSTNRSFAEKFQKPSIGCASHRFNLCVQDMINPSKKVIQKVNGLMKKLKNPIPAAKLRKNTLLRAKCNNATRWSSTAAMLHRFQRIKAFITKLEIPDIDEHVPTYREQKHMDSLCAKLQDLDSVTKALQRDSLTISEVRELFDAVIEKFPHTETRLSSNAKIVRDPAFETGIVKIQEGKLNMLSDDETKETDCLKTYN